MTKIFANVISFLKCKWRLLLCVISSVTIVLTALPIAFMTFAEDDDSNLIFKDDFNRKDSENIGNDWIDGSKCGSIKHEKLNIISGSDDFGASKIISRPVSENGINQSVSVRVSMDDIKKGNRFAIWLRAQNVGTEKNSGYVFVWNGDGINDGSYFVVYKKISTDNSYTVVHKQMMNIKFNNGSWDDDLVLTFSASGTEPTNFSMSMLNTQSNWNPDYSMGSDDTTELQKAGVVCVSSYNKSTSLKNRVMTFDDFSYACDDKYFETTVCYDNFNRKDSDSVGDGWVKTNNSLSSSIKSNKLLFEAGESEACVSNRLERQFSEATVNQRVSFYVDAQQLIDKKFPLLWLRLQNNKDKERAVGYYTTIDGNYIYIGKTSSSGEKNVQTTINKKWFQPSLALYNGLIIEFAATSDGNGSTNLKVNIYCDLKTGTDWVNSFSIVDSTCELQGKGTVGISANKYGQNIELMLDDFSYVSIIDTIPLINLIKSIENNLKINIYSISSEKLIRNVIDEAKKTLKKGRQITQEELEKATEKINATITSAVVIPKINGLKINGSDAIYVSYNTYISTVDKETQSLDFQIDTKSENLLNIVRLRDNTSSHNGLKFYDDNYEEYSIEVSNQNSKALYYVTVYRENSEFKAFEDEFGRDNGPVGNGWTEITKNSTLLVDNTLTISNPDGSNENDFYDDRIIRPYNESAQDQIISVDIPVIDLLNGLVPCFWLRLQNDGDNDSLNDEGYYVKIPCNGNMEVIKRYKKNGTITEKIVGKEWYSPKLLAYEGKFRFEVMIKGTDYANIRIRIRNTITGNGTAWRFTGSFKDLEEPLVGSGTVGVSCNSSVGDMHISYFSYMKYVQPDYMIHCTGAGQDYTLGQWLDVSPNDTYVFTLKLSHENDEGASSVMPELKYSTEADSDSRVFYFDSVNNDSINKTFTGEFKVPSDAVKHLNGDVSVWVGFNSGSKNASSYLYDLRVYKKSDINHNNLLLNSDFKNGLYLWNFTGIYAIMDENLIQSWAGEIVLEAYNSNLFEPSKSSTTDNKYAFVNSDFMWYSNGIYGWSNFGQTIDLVPGKTYIYSFYYNYLLNNWIQPQMKGNIYDVTGESYSYQSISFKYKQVDSKNCLISCEVTIPTRAVLNPDGKTTKVNVIINSGNKGSQAYFYKPMVYQKSDINKTNLLYNADFRRGLEGWFCRNGQTVSIPGVYNSPGYGEIELVPVDYSFFNMSDVAGDGEWWKEFYPNGLPIYFNDSDDNQLLDTDSNDNSYFNNSKLIHKDDNSKLIHKDDDSFEQSDIDEGEIKENIKKSNKMKSEKKNQVNFFKANFISILICSIAILLCAVLITVFLIGKKNK